MKKLTDRQLPRFTFQSQEYEMLGGISRLDFGRKLTASEKETWLALEMESAARKALPGLVGKSFRQACRDIYFPAELVECPASRREVDYEKTIERLKRSIARAKSKTEAAKEEERRAKTEAAKPAWKKDQERRASAEARSEKAKARSKKTKTQKVLKPK